MSSRVCIVCGESYGKPHLVNCPRYTPKTEIDNLHAEVKSLRAENTELRRKAEALEKLVGPTIELADWLRNGNIRGLIDRGVIAAVEAYEKTKGESP